MVGHAIRQNVRPHYLETSVAGVEDVRIDSERVHGAAVSGIRLSLFLQPSTRCLNGSGLNGATSYSLTGR